MRAAMPEATSRPPSASDPEPARSGPAAEAPPPKKGMSNLATRLLTAAVLVPIILWLLYIAPPWAFSVLVFLALAIGSSELMAMTMSGARLQQAWGVVATLGLAAVVLYLPATTTMGALVVLVLTGLLFVLGRPEPVPGAAGRMAWLIGGPVYVGVLVSTIVLLHRHAHGGSWVVLSMMFAWFGDTGAYFAGRAFGRHKLYETVSPKKTIEGSIGGLAGSVVGALLAHFWYLPSLPLLDGVLLALVAGAFGQAGDLCESLLKRSAGVKDSGRLLPGHGGLLDRIDALVFTGPITWLYLTYLHAVGG